MDRVCLYTWYKSANYGTCLQTYALAEYLKGMGFDVYGFSSFKYYYGLRHPVDSLHMLKKRIGICAPIKGKEDHDSAKRIEKNGELVGKAIRIVNFEDADNYKSYLEGTKCFIVGSDQLWNPRWIDFRAVLKFAPKGYRKFSYATSMGVSSLPWFTKLYIRQYLSRFYRISVREETAKNILSGILPEKKIDVVLDPTFLLDKKDWARVASRHADIGTDDFVFCYFVGADNVQWIDEVKSFCI